jgi:hypothetical protein
MKKQFHVASFRLSFLLAAALLLSCLGAALSPSVAAAEANWKVGMARVKITPPSPVWMSGYASRDKPF